MRAPTDPDPASFTRIPGSARRAGGRVRAIHRRVGPGSGRNHASRRILSLLLASLTCASVTGSAAAGLVTVTVGSSSTVDIDWQTATIEDLPGPDGRVSFAEAMIATNNTAGHDTIHFAIPQSDWILQFLFPGRAVVYTSNAYFWRASDQVTVDGTTQTAFTGDTNPNGAEVALYGGELYLNATGCTVMGFDSSNITFSQSNSVATDNTGTMNITLGGGSGSLVKNNVGGTLKIDRSNDNIVVGNTFQRVRVLGFGTQQPAANNRIGGPNPEDRNYLTGYGSWNSEGLPSGFSLQIFDSDGTIVENNSIGTTPDGLAQGSQAANMGIRIEGENHNLVIRDNRIAGVLGMGIGPHHVGQFFGWAIYMIGTGSEIEILGNTIGLDANGEPLLGSVTGIEIGTSSLDNFTDVRIGGTGPGEGNSIAGHRFNGITIGRTMQEARISGNSISGNDDLGIDLITNGFLYGPTANDALDADTGANGLQNFPVIESAGSNGASVRISGSLHSTPLSAFTVEFFASADCDPSGFGEGEVFLGWTSVSTDAAGDGAFVVNLPASVEEGWVVTATATLEPAGSTSEFSACFTVTNDVTSVAGESALDGAGEPFQLHLGRPNPFQSSMTIRFRIDRQADIELSVHDSSGRLVRRLASNRLDVGLHEVSWDARNEQGDRVAPGVYLVRMESDGVVRGTRKVTLAR